MTTGAVSGVKKDVASLRQTDAQRRKRQADVDRKLVEQTKLLREQSQKLLDQERRITPADANDHGFIKMIHLMDYAHCNVYVQRAVWCWLFAVHVDATRLCARFRR